MPKLPRNLSQERALRRPQGGWQRGAKAWQGQFTARSLMANGHPVILPVRLKVGLLSGQIRDAGLSLEEFIQHL